MLEGGGGERKGFEITCHVGKYSAQVYKETILSAHSLALPAHHVLQAHLGRDCWNAQTHWVSGHYRAAAKAEAARAGTATGPVETISGTLLPTPTPPTPAQRP